MNTMKLTDAHRERISARQKVQFALGANQGADLTQWCGALFDQEQEGSCTCCTTRALLLWLQIKYGYSPVTDPDVQDLYYFARLIFGDLSVDGGSTVHDAFQGSITYGVIPSSVDKYDASTLFTPPTMADVVFQASTVTDLAVNTASIRASLDAGMPVGIGVDVTDTLFNPTVYNGMHIVDKGTIQPNEGHAIPVFGYKVDPVHQYLYHIQQSWGTGYGDNGWVWFTEAFLQQCLNEVCTLGIPKTKQPPNPAPLPNVTNNFVLQIGTDKPSYTVGDQAYVWVTLTNNGQDLIGQVVEVKISDGNDGPVPIAQPGHNGFPWGPSNPGTYTLTAIWQNVTATCQATFTEPQPKPNPTPTPPAPPKPPSPTPSNVSGGDVSRFQSNVQWSQVEKSWVFGIAKVMDGLTPIDPQFSANYAGMKAAGVIRGGYQVGYPANETAQAAYAAYKKAVGVFELGPILDLEDASCGSLTKDQITAWAVEWLVLGIKDFGYAVLYSGENFLNMRIDVSQLPKGTLLWVANYSQEPKLKWTFWQHTDAAKVQGITGQVDTDYFNGTLDDLKALIVKEVEDVQQTKVQVNGKEYRAVIYGPDTYVLWSALDVGPGFSHKNVNGEWQFSVPVGVDPLKVSKVEGLLNQAAALLQPSKAAVKLAAVYPKTNTTAIVLSVLGAVKLGLSAFGVDFATDAQMTDIANGVAALVTVVGPLLSLFLHKKTAKQA